MFGSPGAPTAALRNVLVGHAVGLAAGQVALALTGLAGAPSTLAVGVGGARVLAVMLAVGLTEAGTRALAAPHPPAGATTLIVALGLLQGPRALLVMAVAVALLAIVAPTIARLLGLPAPPWSVAAPEPTGGARSGDPR